MGVTVYKLVFPQGIHVGKYGIGTEGVHVKIPADTIFSALLATWISLGQDPDHWVSAFPRARDGTLAPADPPFLITSAFPFCKSVLLFPKPSEYELGAGLPDDLRKKWKKTQFVSEAVLRSMAKGTELAEIIENSIWRGTQILVTKDEEKEVPPEEKPIWKEHRIPRVVLDRVSSASNLFHVGRVDFAENAGLWFGVIWRDPDRTCGDHVFKEAFELALRALSHSGIGGERTYGYGIFEPELMDEFSWPDPVPGKPALLLSRYNPRPNEIPHVLRDAPGYRLEEVRGWTSSPHGQFRRRPITMLAEGSVLQAGENVMGQLVDVGPIHVETKQPLLPHPVWRYGLAALFSLGGAE